MEQEWENVAKNIVRDIGNFPCNSGPCRYIIERNTMEPRFMNLSKYCIIEVIYIGPQQHFWKFEGESRCFTMEEKPLGFIRLIGQPV